MRVGDQVERYLVQRHIGAGGAADVYAVRHLLLGTQHALKVLRSGTAGSASDLLREGRFQARLDGDRVISVTDIIDVNGLPALLMPLVDGCSLRQVLDTGPLPRLEALTLFRDVVDAVGLAHEQDVVHCDLKPSNVLLDLHRGAVRVRVSDFGLAFASSSAGSTRSTASCTPAYASPEQFDRAQRLDRSTDLWSLGVLLFELLTGRLPFAGDSLQTLRGAVERVEYDAGSLEPTWTDMLAEVWVDAKRRPRDVAFWQRLPAIRHLPPLRTTSDTAGRIRAHRAARVDGPSHASPAASNETMAALIGSNTVAVDLDSPGALPAPRDPFIGRTQELRTLREALANPGAVVTVSGPPGVGKSRLVQQCAHGIRRQWAGGVWLCALQEARSARDVFQAVLAALMLPTVELPDAQSVGRALDSLGPCCLILDQAGAVLDAVVDLLDAWPILAPDATFVLTSRLAPAIESAAAFTLAPMSPADSRALFACRAEAGEPCREVDVPPDHHVEAILPLLDGLPFAIELAASRAGDLESAARFARLGADVEAPPHPGTESTAAPRSLESTLDWSWALLDDWAQSALAQLSTFDGAFCSEAIDEVVQLDAFPDAPWTLMAVQILVEHSLVQAVADDRFALLTSVKSYAGRALDRLGERVVTEARHGRWLAKLCSPQAIDALNLHGGAAHLRILQRERRNLETACRRAIVRGDAETALDTLAGLLAVIECQGPLQDALRWLDETHAIAAKTPIHQARHGYWRSRLGLQRPWTDRATRDWASTDAALRESGLSQLALDLEIRRLRPWQEGLPFEEGQAALQALWSRLGPEHPSHLGVLLMWTQAELLKAHGRYPEADVAYADAIEAAARSGARRLKGNLLHNRAEVLGQLGDEAQRGGHLREALAIAREVGNRVSEGNTLAALGQQLALLGQIPRAKEHFRDAIACAQATGHRKNEPVIRTLYGEVLLLSGELDACAEEVARVRRLARANGDRIAQGFAELKAASVEMERGDLPAAEHHAVAGRALLEAEGHPWGVGVAEGLIGEFALELGNLARAREILERSLDVLQTAHPQAAGSTLGTLAVLEQSEGRPAQATAALAQAERLLSSLRGSSHFLRLLLQKVRVLGAQGRWAEAQRALDRADQLDRRRRAKPTWPSAIRRREAASWLKARMASPPASPPPSDDPKPVSGPGDPTP